MYLIKYTLVNWTY